ncbi:MAG: RND transporter [Gammaproteobacteria bacterium RIFCSPHIGHO2_12_FULL_41_20]|nr:MAG: RND transporter [Gammaproteobacteria bacterium RIFCSPHIGHO2_12_FULL_41_20]
MDACKRCTRLFCLMLISAYSSGCMVGPNFHTLAAPKVHSYTQTPLPKKTVGIVAGGDAGKSQAFVVGATIQAQWWQLFHSPAINYLVQTGLANSPTLAAAQAALQQAQEALAEQIGNSLYPAFNAALSGQRQRFAGASFGGGVPSNIFSIYNASVNVSYTLDVFGGARRQIESLQAQVDYQQFQLIAAYLTLTSNIVTTAITIASLEAQIAATHKLIWAEEKQLVIMRNQLGLGGVADSNVLTQLTAVEQIRATLPPLEKSLSQSKHAMDVLIGSYPNRVLPKINLDKLKLASVLPVSLPSYLVRQRPDVRSSEASLHSASAQVGVATANLFPQFTLSGDYGGTASIPSVVFQPNSRVWTLTGGITQPIFHGGALLAQRRAAIAAYNQAAAQYRQTVLQAFQNVADTLRALDMDARTFQAQKAAEIAAWKNLKVTREQYQLGGVDYLNVLTAEQQYQQTRLSSIQAQATRYSDTAALFQALGGGWWNRKQYACKSDPINPTNATLCSSLRQ